MEERSLLAGTGCSQRPRAKPLEEPRRWISTDTEQVVCLNGVQAAFSQGNSLYLLLVLAGGLVVLRCATGSHVSHNPTALRRSNKPWRVCVLINFTLNHPKLARRLSSGHFIYCCVVLWREDGQSSQKEETKLVPASEICVAQQIYLLLRPKYLLLWHRRSAWICL